MGHVIRSLIRISGIMLIVVGFSMLLTFIVSLICSEFQEGLCFLLTGASLAFIGFISRILCKDRQKKLHLGDGFLIVTLFWIIMSAAGAVPYLVSGTLPDPAEAFFESASGFTTTGATVMDQIQTLPHGILFWRAMTCWLGGIGILLIAITLMPALGLNGQRLNTPDNYGPVIEQVSPRMIDSVRTIIMIYTGLTFLETILLTLSGMTLFNGLIHSMSTISTGGFCRYDNGITHFGSNRVLLIMSFFMIVSGMNFHLFLHRPKNSLRNFFRNSEIRLYLVLLTGSFILISAIMIVQDTLHSIPASLSNAIFMSASFLTTTGFISTDYGLWPQFAQMTLLFLMFCGACTASAGGGIKVARVSILLKLVRHGISTRLHSNFFETVRMNGQGMAADAVSGVATMPFLYLVALFTGTFLLTLGDVSLSSAFNASIACLCNTGHAFGALGFGGTFTYFGDPSKILLSFLMIGGRLELYAIIILLTPKYWTQAH